MEGDYGFWSLLPPIVAIILAIATKQVFISLLAGIFMGWLMIHNGNVLTASFATVQALVDVFQDAGNTRTIMFCALVGALIIFMQRSGGVAGFIEQVGRRLERYAADGGDRGRIMVQLLTWATGIIIFVETSISVLTTGTLYRPIFDQMRISREKLAYITDSTSAPASILIPFNGWGAFIMGLLAAQGFADPFATLFQSMPWNFYPIIALLIVPAVILWRRDIGPMQQAEERTRNTGQLLWDNAQPMVSEDLTEVAVKEGVVPRAFNMVIPIATMVLLMPITLAYTGWEGATAADASATGFNKIFLAIGQGSGSTAVLIAVLASILVSMVLYRVQRIMDFKEMIDLTLKGIGGMMPLALLMMLAFAIGALCKQLETGAYVASVTESWLSSGLVPFLMFLTAAFIAFATGTSWGTFAIMIPIAVPMAQQMGADVTMTIAAVLGGGVFGDHCSPISDTTILASLASATDHIDHVKTQLPYALIGGIITALAYLIVGIM